MDRNQTETASLHRPYRWYTIAETFEQICHHQEPWVAIGNFLNDWWYFAVEQRRELIETPLPPATRPETLRWAAFCAAMVEWLCWQDDLAFPEWTSRACYTLADPWFLQESLARRAKLLVTTPAPFKMRNIFGGDRMFLNKGDLAKIPTAQEK